MNVITDFEGEYEFLNNFYEVPVTYEGITYGSSESAFQAAKSLDPADRERISKLPPDEAKRAGYRVKLRSDWRDTFWGFDVNLGYGVNMLGQLLMRLRAEHQGKL